MAGKPFGGGSRGGSAAAAASELKSRARLPRIGPATLAAGDPFIVATTDTTGLNRRIVRSRSLRSLRSGKAMKPA
jgi:hypothetical protein